MSKAGDLVVWLEYIKNLEFRCESLRKIVNISIWDSGILVLIEFFLKKIINVYT